MMHLAIVYPTYADLTASTREEHDALVGYADLDMARALDAVAFYLDFPEKSVLNCDFFTKTATLGAFTVFIAVIAEVSVLHRNLPI